MAAVSSRTAGNAAWLTACRLAGDGLNLLLFVLISRQFGPAGVGAYSYGFAVATFAYVIGCLGIEEYGIRQYARMAPERQPVFLAELLGTQSLMVGLAFASVAIYLLVTGPEPAKLAIILEVTCFQVAAAITQSLFIPEMAYQRMAYPALAQFAARVIACVCAGVAIYCFHASLASALVGYPLAAAIWIAMAVVSARGRGALRLTITAASVRQIGGILWSFALIEIFIQLFTRIGVIVLSLGVGDAAAGLFATGLRLIETALMPLAFLGVAAYPRLSQLFVTDLAAFRRPALQLTWVMLFAGMLLAWGLYFVAPVLLVPVLGERFAAAAPIIQAMAALGLVQAVELGLGRVLLCANLQVPRALFIAAGAVASVTLNAVLAPRYGVYGALIASVAAYLLINALSARALGPPLSKGALWPLAATLAGSVVLVVGLEELLVVNGVAAIGQAIVCAVVLALLGAAGYRFQFRAGGAPEAQVP